MATHDIDYVIDAVADGIGLVSQIPVIRGNQNRTPMPDEPFICLTEMFHEDLETPHYKFDGVQNTVELRQPYRVTIQADVYGAGACNIAAALVTAMNSVVFNDHMPADVQILFCGDLKQATMVDAQDQFLERWNCLIQAQHNPTVELAQEHADVAVVTIREV